MFNLFSRDKNKAKTAKLPELPVLLCLRCFEDNKPPHLYALCRNNPSSKKRHCDNQHNGNAGEALLVSPRQMEAKDALSKWKKQNWNVEGNEQGTSEAAVAASVSKRAVSEASVSSVGYTAEELQSPPKAMRVEMSESSIEADEGLCTTIDDISLLPPTKEQPQKEAAEQQQVQSEHQDTVQLSSIVASLDKLAMSVNSLMKQHTMEQNTRVADSHSHVDVNWDNINCLNDLLTRVNIYKSERRVNSLYVKCVPCNQFITSVEGIPHQKRFKRNNSIPHGLLIANTNENNFSQGVGHEWSRFKSTLKKHYLGLDHISDVHYNGLKCAEKLKNEFSTKFKTHKVFMKAALEIISTKSSAESYEVKLANLMSVGVQIGNIQHSRKQFPELVDALCLALDRRLDNYLSVNLPSTGTTPFFCLTFDKSTFNRVSNQAVMLITIMNGSRQALFIDAPLVYSVEEGQTELSGGQSESLAFLIISTLKQHLPNIQLNKCAGAVADGQYQNKRFTSSLLESLSMDETSEFHFVLWDGGHLLDLAAKKFQSTPFMKRLLKRIAMFHTKLGYGKMHQITQSIGETTGHKSKVTLGTATTRFVTSQLSAMRRISDCYFEYITALYDYGGVQKNCEVEEDKFDEDEPLLVGRDFIIDLLGVIDVLCPVVELMIELQKTQHPCWKVVLFTAQTVRFMRAMLEDINEKGNSWNLDSTLWPTLSSNINDVLDMRYKNVALVEGWLIDSSVKPSRKGHYGWMERLPEDCHTDIRNFLSNLIDEINQRTESAIQPGVTTLCEAMDLQQLIATASGKYSTELKRQVCHGNTETSSAAFSRFFKFVKTLSHAEGMEDDEHFVLGQATEAVQWLIWTPDLEIEDFNMKKDVFKVTDENVHMPNILPSKVSFNHQMFRLYGTFEYPDDLQQPSKIKVLFDEEAFVRHMYKSSSLYKKLGKDFCYMYDLALAKGSSEAVVESLYSVMKLQIKCGTHKPESYVKRTKVDWHFPRSCLGIETMINEATELYSQKHMAPFSGTGNPSKVMNRLSEDTGRIPPMS